MNPEIEAEHAKQIGIILLSNAPEDWQRIKCTAAFVDHFGEIWNYAVMPDGSKDHFWTSAKLSMQFESLRNAMYRPGKGTWFSATYHITPPASYSIDFNYDQEAMTEPPTPSSMDYYNDLQLFPRDPEHIPDWLQEKIREAEQE
ncbi:hypothetical protein [Nocardiopsis sp. NPDC006832]|uniref:hypothetical protein n=1 Tax=Nocardiopsis sp. NPDC006832 TaxID=3157188 RepID=UPI0033FD053D